MNEAHIFDLTQFMNNPSDIEKRVSCIKIDATEGLPSTRWGHAAASYDGNLYILGGRNE
jgi:hypothetical protein